MTINRKNIKNWLINGWFILLLLLLLFVPDAKALFLRGLMSVGLFKPDVSQISKEPTYLKGIVFKDGRGNSLDLGDLRGKVIFLNFWATWCPPCLAEMPSVNRLYETFKNNDQIVFLFVDADNNYPKAKQYMDRKGYALPVYNVASALPEKMFGGSLPTTVIFDKEGRLSFKHEGAADYDDKRFSEFLEKLSKK